jgi:2-phosphosulfolactate phosphatase
MNADRAVVIDFLPESAERYIAGWAIVAVDVIRATTTAVTAVWSGRRCFPVASLEAGVPLAARLTNPLLVGELGGNAPYGFHLTNSPAQVAHRTDVDRPMILLSTSGTPLLHAAAAAEATYAACLRNVTATVDHLTRNHARVALLGAGSRCEFRREDQLGCAWIAKGLVEAGYACHDSNTAEIIERWRDADVDACTEGRSAEYLRRTGQVSDLEFICAHVDDVPGVFRMDRGELVMSRRAQAAAA